MIVLKRQLISLRIPKDIYRKALLVARLKETSFNSLAVEAIREVVDRWERENFNLDHLVEYMKKEEEENGGGEDEG